MISFFILISFQHCGNGGSGASNVLGTSSDPLTSGACANSIVAGKWNSTAETGKKLIFTSDCHFTNEFCKSTGTYPANLPSNAGTALMTVESKASDAPIQCPNVGTESCQYKIDKTVTPNELDIVCGNVWGTYKKETSPSTAITITTTTTTNTNTNANTNSVFNGSTNTTIVSQYNNIKSSISCLPGRNRLVNDVSFYVQGSITDTHIGGNWQSGFLNNGTVSDLYVGVSAFRDLMFLTKVTNGDVVVGYNVTLSFCEVPNAYTNYPALVSNDRPLVSFQAPYGIYINTAKPCGYGLIASAQNTVIVSQRSSEYPYTSDYPIYTSFAAPSCQ